MIFYIAYTAVCLGEKKHAPHVLRRSSVGKDPAARDGAPNRYDVS